MNNIATPFFAIIGLILAIFGAVGLTIIINDREPGRRSWRRKHRHKLYLQVHFNNKKHPFFMSVNTVTLVDLLPHKGVISVVDQNNNTISGKLSNISISPADPSVDTATSDPSQANTIDVTAVTPTGGTTLNLTADFVADSPVNGQTTFTGLKGTVTVINNVTTQLSLQVNF